MDCRAAAAVCSALIAGCTFQHYQPAPLEPGASAAAFDARSLADPGLRAFEERALGRPAQPWPPAEWDLNTLSLAALYFNPQLDEARADLAEAQAALLTAGARPNPTLAISPGVPSPYLLSVDLLFPLETAGKRGYRRELAQRLAQASQLELAEAAWTVRGAVRAALVDFLLAGQRLELSQAEVQVRETQVKILEQRLQAGESRRLEVDAARSDLSKAHSARRSAEEEESADGAKLAAAIGIPLAALRAVHLTWPEIATPPAPESLSLGEIERDAVINRLDVRAALARYAAAEAALQLEVAKQYPDIDIGPGYTYEERQSYFTIGLSAAIPLLDRNRGPIAEAEARRRKAAAQFVDTQAQALASSAQAFAVYAVARGGLREAERLAAVEERRRADASEATRLGEADGLELAEAQLQYSIAARARLDALAHVQHAFGELERAVERPLAPAEEIPGIRELEAPARAAER